MPRNNEPGVSRPIQAPGFDGAGRMDCSKSDRSGMPDRFPISKHRTPHSPARTRAKASPQYRRNQNNAEKHDLNPSIPTIGRYRYDQIHG